MKAWLFFMVSAVFLLCISQQRAFAGCTDEFDANGSDCQSSGNCSRGCGGGFGIIQARQSAPRFGDARSSASLVLLMGPSKPQSRSISSTSMSLLLLLFSPVILYRRQPNKWAGIFVNQRGRS
jgi:hypothetical protein